MLVSVDNDIVGGIHRESYLDCQAHSVILIGLM